MLTNSATDGKIESITYDNFYNLQLTSNKFKKVNKNYRIYSINRPGRLFNFGSIRLGAFSRWALIRGWAFIIFPTFSASEDIFRE